jgi:hypothetical protein
MAHSIKILTRFAAMKTLTMVASFTLLACAGCQGLIQNFDFPRWADFMAPALSNTYTSFVDGLDYPRYSDLTIGGAHGNGATIGGYAAHTWIPWLKDAFTPEQLRGWLQAPNIAPQWRVRKAAVWACLSSQSSLYSIENPGPHGETNQALDFVNASGIRPFGIQMNNYIHKNTGWFINGLLPQLMQGPSSVDSSAKVAETADELWICGAFPYPGGCDPTYASIWVVDEMQGLYPILAPGGGSQAFLDIYGYPYMPYTSIYDDNQLLMHSDPSKPPFVHTH